MVFYHVTENMLTSLPYIKRGSRKEPRNYGLVSLTSVVAEITESIVRDITVEHLMSFDLFFAIFQPGFTLGRCTQWNTAR